MDWITITGWIFCIFFVGFSVYYLLSSLIEREQRAVFTGFGLLLFPGLCWCMALIFLTANRNTVLISINAFVILSIVIILFPFGNKNGVNQSATTFRFDERDTMFARARYVPGSELYGNYYSDKPEKESLDLQFRQYPEMAEAGAPQYDNLYSPIVQAEFHYIESMQKCQMDNNIGTPAGHSPEQVSVFIKNLACYFGADIAGIALLRPDYVYSHYGRRFEKWGEEIPVRHKYAVAFAVEMDYEMVKTAPRNPTIIETARVYSEGARISLLLAHYLNRLGYSAEAHYDSHYEVILPPICAEAGLGEVGRMSLLMTYKYGPRVRLGMVTTDAPMVPDSPVNYGMTDFCKYCKKCAVNCPSGAISADDPEIVNGTTRWVINPEKCYTFWRSVGTDCGICMKVCPYSHPATFTHNIVRRISRMSTTARRVVSAADDLFYGKGHISGKYPAWMPERMRT